MKKTILLVIALFATSVLGAKSIWIDGNHFAPSGTLKQGDIIIININDVSNLQFDLSLKNSSDASTESNPDMTITGFLPKVKGDKKIKNNDATTFSGKGKFTFSVASRITGRERGGKFTIAGRRAYSFNGVTSTVAVTGIIDPALVRGRQVDSRSVANFRIEIRSTKEGIRLQRPALKKDEKAEVQLTEAEKRQIILQYLEKMLKQLSR